MAPRQVAKLPIQEMPRLVHELQVYQAELEMQNDELHRIQEELEISRERFVELFDFAPIGYIMLGEDGKIREANLTVAKLLEWNRSELMNLSFERFICPESQDVFYLHRRQVFESNGKQNCRLMLRKPGGGAFAAELESIAVGERSGGIQCFLIALRDITDRELADRALRESEQSLAEFFEDAPVGLIWVDPGGRVLRINRAQLEFLERSRDGVLGSSVADLFVDPEVATDMLLRLAEEKPLKECRARLRCGGGRVKHVLIDANGLWVDGQLVHSRWFVRDITLRVELEHEILAISDREKERLGQDLHDDLCQQLSGIEFLTHTLAQNLSEGTCSGAAEAREIGELIRAMIDRTRELAHGLSPLVITDDALMNGLAELASRTSKHFNVRCVFTCDEPVLIDNPEVSVHLYRIAQEAVTNSVKHGGSRTIQITLSLCSSHLVLSVRDDGVGFSERDRSRDGMGLRVMQYRAEAICGSFSVHRLSHGGIEVVCRLKSNYLEKNKQTNP